MNAGRSQGPLLFRQERDPELQSILRQPQRDLTFMVPPDGEGRAAQRTVNGLMIGSDNVEGDITLQLTQGQRGMFL